MGTHDEDQHAVIVTDRPGPASSPAAPHDPTSVAPTSDADLRALRAARRAWR